LTFKVIWIKYFTLLNPFVKEVFMKKVILFVVATLLLLASTAMADSITGKFGITGRGGISYNFDSKLTDDGVAFTGTDSKIKVGPGWAAGGGIMYGITDNLAVEFDVIYGQAKAEIMNTDIGVGKTIDFALGAQWRFMPQSKFVPYVGAGLDVFWNKFSADQTLFGDTSIDVAVTYGAHVSAGVDFFIMRNLALNAEIRGVYSTDGDMKASNDPAGTVFAKYNPSNISGFLGIRFFFP
jgi:outer membrane protein